MKEKVYSEQEHIVEIDEEYLESSDISPHATIINHEPPVISVREYNDGMDKIDD